ncbi:actin nucleation-promoting factor WASL-like [Dermacentor variabilis]|uniref:actin nucleation-promoting factor WASL-like n=1 Tax=Dermacentor variabilis TaxID=34621 RepID=UPI003F5BAB9D
MRADMSHHQQPLRNAYRPGPEMRGSVHLTAEENETVVSACRDRRWQVIAMGIAEVYQSGPPPRHDRWQRCCCGVACFIKDNAARAFFIRLFDFDRRDFTWEQELFVEFTYKSQLPYFHTFEADDCQAGLNFAFEDEAANFGNAIEEKLRSRRQKREERNRLQMAANKNDRSFPVHDPRIPTCPSTNGILSQHNKKSKSSNKKGKKQKERKYTKADISNPTDFKHIQHVGWDPDKGFDLENYVDSKELNTLFEMAMVTENDLKEPGTRQFIYEFIAKNGGADMIKGTAAKAGHAATPAAPPAVPSREHTSGPPSRPPPHPHAPPPPNGAVPRSVPPPPPARTGQTRAPPTPLSNGRMARSTASPQAAPPPPPPPPPPPSMGGGAPPPPPPIPAAATANGIGGGGAGGAGQDVRGALLEQIRKGKPLNHVDPETESTHSTNSNPDARGALLDQIRGGIRLKSVPDSARTSPSETKLEGLAGALARALQERAKACMPDDSDSSDDSESEEDDWDD